MERERLRQLIESLNACREPRIAWVKRGKARGPRLGVFAASFNPVTVAHVELMRNAAEQFSFDETLALASRANADKGNYECSLEDRLAMLCLTFADDLKTSIGLSSHAYFVDMVEALERLSPAQTDLHFVVGFDTFERVLDLKDLYTSKYHRKFSDRLEALEHLLARSYLVVAGRAGTGYSDLLNLIEAGPERLRERVAYLDLPADLGEQSATEVRKRARADLPIDQLVPQAVARYIKERDIYKAS